MGLIDRLVSILDWTAARWWRVALVVGLAALLVTWFIQLFLLGVLFPHWSDGEGLIRGHDASRFHQRAVEQAQLINEYGWGAWELRPGGWSVAGVLSAWYALTLPAPWIWAPVQSLMFGLGGALLFVVLHEVTESRRIAAIAALAVLALPSAAILYAFPHRDIFIFLGLMLAIFGWSRLAAMQGEPWPLSLWLALWGSTAVLAGYLLAWVSRTFAAEIFQGLAGIVFILLSLFAVVHLARRRPLYLGTLASPVIALALLAAMYAWHAGGEFGRHLATADTSLVQSTELRQESGPASGAGQISETEPEKFSAVARKPLADQWHRVGWLPHAIDDRLRRLAGARDRFIVVSGHGRTALDIDVSFRSAQEMLEYLPRALQIGLFSPFVHQWLPSADAPVHRNVERVIVGAEMVFLYPILAFLLFAIWRWARRPVFWLALVPALSWILVYALTVPVVGALVRYRYAAYVVILALALAGLLAAISDLQRRLKARRRRLDGEPIETGPTGTAARHAS